MNENCDINEPRNRTKYTYDGLQRTISMSFPDLGNTSIGYGRSVPEVITTTISATPDPDRIASTTQDTLGRTSQSTLPNGATTQTTYDSRGRVLSVTNPFFSTQDPTYGVTTFAYDALDRVINQADSDSISHRVWAYSGNLITSTDENGNQWAKTTDALGRLTKMLEPNGSTTSPSMETDYTYDGLNNLLSVTQWGGSSGSSGARTRMFSYDGLSRLIQSYNPESGWMCYGTTGGAKANGSNCTSGYDSDGNLIYKTDARGTTATYSYDSLNRLLGKTFSDGATPSSCYQYDSTSVTNGIERLTSSWTQSASTGPCPVIAPTTATAFWTKHSILSYDPMGRIKSEQQYTPSYRASGTPYSPVYAYDLAGSLISSTTGVGPTPTSPPITFTNAYDGAGHLQSLTSSYTNNSSFPSTIFSPPSAPSTPCAGAVSAQYAAFGGLANALYGNGLTLNRGFDNRLRTTCEVDTGSIVANPTSGSATVTITGVEQIK